jgi:predicted Zn finger-like uncharacterized protein
MADKVPIICPECAKQFQVPEDIVGRKIRCKNCGKAFVAERAEDVNPAQKKAESATIPFLDDDDDDGDGKPYEVTSIDLAPRCPSCANELESETAKVCLHCGFNLETRTAAERRRVKDVTGGDIFLHLLPGILSAIGFFVSMAVMLYFIANRLYLALNPEQLDKAFDGKPEQWQLNCFNCCTLWTAITCMWLMYISGKFAIKRLIYDNKPPEREL